MKKIHRLLWLLLPFVFLLASCQKDPNFQPVEKPNGHQSGVLKTTGTIIGDTIRCLPNLVLKVWVEELPDLPAGINYLYDWYPGDGSADQTYARFEHKYETGLYHLMVAITNPISGTVWNFDAWIKVAAQAIADGTIIVISSNQVVDGWNYLLGFKASTIGGFQEPPYTQYNVPFVTGSFCEWQLNPPPPNPDYVYIDGDVYLTRNIVYLNGSTQELHFGQGTNWSYNPESGYWVWTGSTSGKYVIYPYNGQIFNTPPGTVFCPGEDGDEPGGTYPPTVRDSLMLGETSATDSLRLFINYQSYANGESPFISYAHLGVWNSSLLIPIGNTGWGYYSFSVADAALDYDRIYFKFGPNISQASVFGDMTRSTFYDPATLMCGIQLASFKNGGRRYIVTTILK